MTTPPNCSRTTQKPIPAKPQKRLHLPPCVFTSSTRAISRLALPSLLLAGCMCWPRPRQPNTAIRSSWTKPSTSSIRRPSRRATWWASAFTAATPCAVTRSAARPASAAPRSSSAASTRRSTRTKRSSSGGAHAVVKGDGDRIWPLAINACLEGTPQPIYDGGRVEGGSLLKARWDLLPPERYMWASVQTVRGCPKHCSFCSVWRTDGQKPRVRASDAVIEEIVELRRKGFRFIALADDNFYPVAMNDLRMADRRADKTTLNNLKADPRRALRADGAAGQAAQRHGLLHADHDGGGRRSGVPRRDAQGQHQGRARRRRVGDARGPEGRLQGLQLRRRRAGRRGCRRSASTACTCSARSSSGCRPIGRRRSRRRRRWRSAPTSPSRSS